VQIVCDFLVCMSSLFCTVFVTLLNIQLAILVLAVLLLAHSQGNNECFPQESDGRC
jgi:hypothetical protein